ncbi:separin protein [Recurvomyces mirabilis]|uniref:separase n=1 Tax=Recurvomyces mirabilis TaxID=574656 RepID=A0AAE0WNF9_9PEZI|nr:separin protein [Recurvomyces mirabilis]KAK5157820.1 separin protein [Recurvomyces mirabilis]
MRASKAQCEAIKSSISDGTTSTSTISAFRDILGLNTRPATTASMTKPKAKTADTVKSSIKKVPPKKRVPDGQAVHDVRDDADELSSKDRYVLATEVVNTSLKFLSAASKDKSSLKAAAESRKSPNVSPTVTPRPGDRSRVLRPTSGNASPKRAGTKPATIEQVAGSDTTGCITNIVQCARLAFSFLKSNEAKGISNAKDQTLWQLDSGIIAFAGKLTVLGFDFEPELSLLRHVLLPRQAIVITSQMIWPEDKPAMVFELQVLALRLKQLSTNDQVSLDAFHRFLEIFRRQSHDGLIRHHARVVQYYVLLEISTAGMCQELHFDILRVFVTAAEALDLCDEALKWTASMQEACSSLGDEHARHVACTIKRLRLSSDETDCSHLLYKQTSGRPVDYDMLLEELACYVTARNRKVSTEMSRAAARYAQRYSRSYRDRNSRLVVTIIQSALSTSLRVEDTARWVTLESARVYYRNGTLRKTAHAAAQTNMTKAWSIDSEAVALRRVLQALLWQAAGSQASESSPYLPFEDSDALTGDEKAVLLHGAILDMPEPKKSRPTLPKVVEHILAELSNLYEPSRYPLRRMAVVTQVARLRAIHGLQPHIFEQWTKSIDLDAISLAKDDALGHYLLDVQTMWTIAMSFDDGRPPSAQLVAVLDKLRKFSGEDEVYDVEVSTSQLFACATYFDMMGDEHNHLLTLRLQQRLGTPSAIISLAGQYLRLGYTEKALPLLADAKALHKASERELIEELNLDLTLAECHVVTGDFVQAEADLERTKAIRELLPPEGVARAERKGYELLHARAWIIRSKLCAANGPAKGALAAAKRAVKLLQATWAAAERATGENLFGSVSQSEDIASPDVPDVNALATGVSKLQLTPIVNQTKSTMQTSRKGAGFWPIVSPMCEALMHLSDLYSHHGVFAEADYYSERAIRIAESITSKQLLAHVRVHRCRLQVLAGQLEAAELCLTQSKDADASPAPWRVVERQCAEAELRTKEGSFEEATVLYREATALIRTIRSHEFLKALDISGVAPDSDPTPAVGCERPTVSRSAMGKIAKAKSTRTAKRAIDKIATVGHGQAQPVGIVLDDLLTRITFKHALTLMRVGRHKEASTLVAALPVTERQSFSQRHYENLRLMQDAAAILEADVTFSMLAESTLACPTVLPGEKLMQTTGRPAKSRLDNASTSSEASELLVTARQCLLPKQNDVVSVTTATAHHDASLFLEASMYLASIGTTHAGSRVHPARAASQGEYPRTHAQVRELATVEVDIEAAESSSPFQWPSLPKDEHHAESLTAVQFQEQYVDILPESWTAVSLYPNAECTELYAVRYRAGQSPFLLRLPFSRHKPDAENEEPFDYNKGKAELQDIVAASNYSCHNTKGMEGKGAKSNWWTEREALDRRLHELLLNMENIWFGGFKSIFSQQARHPELLARFRKTFDDILLRHLPSRRSTKPRTGLLALDSKVLELFVGLGNDENDTVDTDEPLMDLLYFVVDMLQFSGEHNAYDEIDFDSMVVDVQDALRSYHDAPPRDGDEARHTILILDKRLQAFPWESLPCLESASVSRVGSMLSLRESVLAMRDRHRVLGVDHDRHVVDRKSGTYILNPSNDLVNTQTMLQDPLAVLAKAPGAKWIAMVQQAPKEEEFKQALTDSSILLYFGHGAGSQYIRPRTIRRLEKCSEVVWLMGCSSGAITEYGELEPFAVPFAYLMAGSTHDTQAAEPRDRNNMCMAAIGTLWDVTDKDVDRFSLAVGEQWGLWAPSEASKLPTKTPKKPQRHLVAPSTPQQVPKTPKTPKVGKTSMAAAKTPTRSRSRSKPRQSDGRKRSLVEAVSRSRDACYLRYLNGAAPVVYGVPVYLGD